MLRKFWIHLFFLVISVVLTFIWFHEGLIIALGESAIPFYNLGNVFHFYGHAWSPIATGFHPGTTLTIYSFFGLGLPFYALNVPGFLIQAVFTFSLIFGMLEGSHSLSSLMMRGKFTPGWKFPMTCSLFYTFNLICLVSVWNRVQYPFILFYVLLPITLWFFESALIKKDFKRIIILNLILLPFSPAYSAIPFFILAWIVLGLYALFLILINHKNKGHTRLVIIYLISTVLIWIIFNAWWFLQFLQWALTRAEGAYTLKGNINTLMVLSDVQGNLSFVFRLINKGFFDQISSVWGNNYLSTPFTLISYIVPFLAFFPLLIKKKPAFIYFFLALAIIIIYFTKGSAGPFGGLFLFMFSQIHPLETFRGAFEKFGLVLPLAYAPLVGFSTVLIFNYIKNKFGSLYSWTTFGALSFILFVVLVFPYWNGWIFTYPVPHANNIYNGDYVKVPEYYKAADQYLNESKADFRVYAMPAEGDGVTFNWPHSFTGIDYSNGIFSKSFLSLTSPEESLGFIMNQFLYTFDKSPENFTKLMAILNAKYVMVRTDVDYNYRSMRKPQEILNYIKTTKIPNLEFAKKFNQLYLFKNTQSIAKIYPVRNIYTAPKDVDISNVMNLTEFSDGDAILNTGVDIDKDLFLLNKSRLDITKPTFFIDYTNYPSNDLQSAQTQLHQYLRFLPGSKMYSLIRLKEQISGYFEVDPEDKYFMYIDLSGKRMAELQAIALANDRENIEIASQNYINNIKMLPPYLDSAASLDIYKRNIEYFRYRMISEGIILSNLVSTVHDPIVKSRLGKTEEEFNFLLAKLDVIPLYDSLLSTKSARMVYRFQVKEDGDYSLVIQDDHMLDSYEPMSGWSIQMDSSLANVNPVSKNGFLDFGAFNLSKGIHEIQISIPTPVNLAMSSPLSGKIDNATEKERIALFSFKNFDRYSRYKMKFDYKLNQGYGIAVDAISDIDYIVDGKNPSMPPVRLEESVPDGPWGTYLNIYNFSFGVSDTSISFTVTPDSACERSNRENESHIKLCHEDPEYRSRFFEPIDFQYKNVFVERIFTNPVLLVKDNKAAEIDLPKITYEKISPSEYLVRVQDAKEPFFIKFSESFHSMWQAEYFGGDVIPNSQHFLADSYANAWFVDKTGDFDMRIYFEPENKFRLGAKITTASIILSIVILFYSIVIKRKSK